MEGSKNIKLHPADEAAREWLDEQTSRGRDTRSADILLLILIALILALVALLIFILPKQRVSEKENRVLAELPSFSIRSLTDGNFTERLSRFYSDRIPFRNSLIELKSVTELLFLRSETGGVLYCRDGYLVKRLEYGEVGYRNITENLEAIELFERAAGISTHVAVIPNAVNALGSVLPSIFSTERADNVYGYLPDSASLLRRSLLDMSKSGEYIWYRTDHHYTTLGAYYVYRYLGDVLGYTPYPMEFFEQTAVSDNFLGTSYSASGLPAGSYDTITLFRYPDDGDFTVRYGDTVQKGFYDMSRLDTKDKYSVFLGGNHSLTSVRLEGTQRETLLVIKDSFAHSLAPFLALHFDLELVDMRYYSSSVIKLCREKGISRALVLCGADTLATAADMKKLETGLYS